MAAPRFELAPEDDRDERPQPTAAEQLDAQRRQALRHAAQWARRFSQVADRLADLTTLEIRNQDGEALYEAQLRHDWNMMHTANSNLMDVVPGLAWLGPDPTETPAR